MDDRRQHAQQDVGMIAGKGEAAADQKEIAAIFQFVVQTDP